MSTVSITTPELRTDHRLLPPEHILRSCDFVCRGPKFIWEPVKGLYGQTVKYAIERQYPFASCHISDWPISEEEVVAEETTLSLLKELWEKIFG